MQRDTEGFSNVTIQTRRAATDNFLARRKKACGMNILCPKNKLRRNTFDTCRACESAY